MDQTSTFIGSAVERHPTYCRLISINKYSPGCHLLNHDDVIGSRLVSYILYLPDEEVCSNGGGKLELYPVLEAGIPDVVPSVIIEPKWNRMVFFTVQPGYAYLILVICVSLLIFCYFITKKIE